MTGSSPLARGAPTSGAMTSSSTRDHPRSRGEHDVSTRAAVRFGGSSPLARGAHHPGAVDRHRARIIPARAGSTLPDKGFHPTGRQIQFTFPGSEAGETEQLETRAAWPRSTPRSPEADASKWPRRSPQASMRADGCESPDLVHCALSEPSAQCRHGPCPGSTPRAPLEPSLTPFRRRHLAPPP